MQYIIIWHPSFAIYTMSWYNFRYILFHTCVLPDNLRKSLLCCWHKGCVAPMLKWSVQTWYGRHHEVVDRYGIFIPQMVICHFPFMYICSVLYRAIIILAYIGVKSTMCLPLVIGRVSVTHRINFCVVVLLLFFFGGGAIFVLWLVPNIACFSKKSLKFQFEDTKVVIRIHKSKDRQHDGQGRMCKILHRKLMIKQHEPH